MKQVTFLLSIIRGAVGKEFVVKHYGNQVVMTRYPNMKGIKPSRRQKQRRSLFKKAVLYAQSIYANPMLKEEKRRILRKPKMLFQALMKEWFKLYKERKEKCRVRLSYWQRNYALNKPVNVIPRINLNNLSNLIEWKDLNKRQERYLKYNSFSPK